MNSYPVELEISGPIALWARPDTLPNPVSYVAPTPHHPLRPDRGENSPKAIFALSTSEPAGDGRARHSVRAARPPARPRRARSDAPYLEVRGEGMVNCRGRIHLAPTFSAVK